MIPKDLRPRLGGKTELRTPLGGDYRQAARKLSAAVAELLNKISQAERQAASEGKVGMAKARFPLSEEKAAFLSYQARVKQDEEARDQEPLYSLLSIDDGYAQHLRDGIAVKLGDVALYELVGHRIDHVVMSGRPLLRKLGNDESMPKAVMSTACVLRSSR